MYSHLGGEFFEVIKSTFGIVLKYSDFMVVLTFSYVSLCFLQRTEMSLYENSVYCVFVINSEQSS